MTVNGIIVQEYVDNTYKSIAARERFIKTHPPLTLEMGDFVIFRLHEIFL